MSGQEAAAEPPSDSLAFEMKKRRILENSPDVRMTAVVDAAEDLARDGFYAEALDLIYDLEDTAWSAKAEAALEAELAREDGLAAADSLPDDSLGAPAERGPAPLAGARGIVPRSPADTFGPGGGPPPAAPKAAAAVLPELQSYVRSSLEYDDWDGSPIGGEVRAKLEWLPEDSFLERLTPTFSGSDRRAYFGLAARGSAFGRVLKVSAEALAEKKMWQTYGDSLDRLSAHAVVEAGTRPLGKAVSVSLPLRGEVEQYRHDRLGLLSRRSLGAAPALEAVSADWRKSVTAAWEARVYRFPSSGPSGFVRQGPLVMANWYGDHFTVELEGQVMDDRYRRDTSMFDSRMWEGRAQAFVRPFPRFKAGLRLHHNGEYSRYADTLRTLTAVLADSPADPAVDYRVDTLVGRYNLQGRVSTVQPVLTLEWAAIYSASLSLAYTRGWYPLLRTHGGKDLFPALFIDESYTAWKPEASFTVLSRKVFLNATAGYELHKPAASPHYYTGYHEVLGLGGNLSWKLGRFMEMDFSGLFRTQTKGASSAALDMTSLSAGITSRFQ